MILSNVAIFEALDDGRLSITPEPAPRLDEPGGEKSPYSTCSVDLTLGDNIQVPNEQLQVAADLRRGGAVAETLAAITTSAAIDLTQGWKLDPGRFVLGQTAERIHLRLPAELGQAADGKPVLAARVEGRSSLARFGVIIHFTAPTIHAGFEGPITLEMMCHSETPFTLYPGMPICQLILEPLVGMPVESVSQFQGQDAPTGERLGDG